MRLHYNLSASILASSPFLILILAGIRRLLAIVFLARRRGVVLDERTRGRHGGVQHVGSLRRSYRGGYDVQVGRKKLWGQRHGRYDPADCEIPARDAVRRISRPEADFCVNVIVNLRVHSNHSTLRFTPHSATSGWNFIDTRGTREPIWYCNFGEIDLVDLRWTFQEIKSNWKGIKMELLFVTLNWMN